MVLKYMFDAFILVFIDFFFPVQIVKWRGLDNLNDWSFSLPDGKEIPDWSVATVK